MSSQLKTQETQDLLLGHSQKIADLLKKSNKFGIYDEDDISQEIFLLVMRAYSSYDSSRGDLFQFLYFYVRRRLLTLKRDKQCSPYSKYGPSKLKIQKAEPIREDSKTQEGPYQFIGDFIDFHHIIDKRIPAHLRATYLMALEGLTLSTFEYTKLIESLRQIMKNYGQI